MAPAARRRTGKKDKSLVSSNFVRVDLRRK
jgi:hypothetical protein